MKTTRKIAWVLVSGTLALAGCASAPQNEKQAWNVTPVMKISHSADHADDWYQKGRSEQEAGRYDLALASYREALLRNSEHIDALNGQAVIHASQGLYEDAITDFRLAIAKAPQRAYLYNNLGYACLLAGRHNEARIALDQALVLEPGHLRAEFNLANLQKQFAADLPVETDVASASSTIPDQYQPLVLTPDTTLAAPQVSLVAVAPQVYELRRASDNAPRVAQSDVIAAVVASASALPPSVSSTVVPMKVRLEVSNGNGTRGMARATARFLNGQGVTTARLTNQKLYDQLVTEIRYRSGYRDAAEQVRNAFPAQAVVQESKALRPDIQVRLVLGKDVKNNVAFVTPSPMTLAMAK